MIITPGEISAKDLHAHLLSSIAPRPICFASTVDVKGNPNLSPFSFFNVFGAQPPICVFSPARRVRDNTTKHTLENILATKEVVINVVNYNIVQQMSLSSCEYPEGVNEFIKAGLTPLKAEIVKPFLVKESPVNLECKVLNVIATGQEGGAGNLIICEVVKMHINDSILGDDGKIDIHKIDLVARMGKDYYCRASGDAVFEVPKPNLNLGVGFDALPTDVRNSEILTGNELGILANSTSIPTLTTPIEDSRVLDILRQTTDNTVLRKQQLHKYAKELIKAGKIEAAWESLLSVEL